MQKNKPGPKKKPWQSKVMKVPIPLIRHFKKQIAEFKKSKLKSSDKHST